MKSIEFIIYKIIIIDDESFLILYVKKSIFLYTKKKDHGYGIRVYNLLK